MPFGPVSLSEKKVVIDEPAPLDWWEALKQRMDNQPQSRVVVPGDYVWDAVRLEIVPAMAGDVHDLAGLRMIGDLLADQDLAGSP